jgi:hypothetical protein
VTINPTPEVKTKLRLYTKWDDYASAANLCQANK